MHEFNVFKISQKIHFFNSIKKLIFHLSREAILRVPYAIP